MADGPRKLSDAEIESALRYLLRSEQQNTIWLHALRLVLERHGVSRGEMDAEIAALQATYQASFGNALESARQQQETQEISSLLEKLDTTKPH